MYAALEERLRRGDGASLWPLGRGYPRALTSFDIVVRPGQQLIDDAQFLLDSLRSGRELSDSERVRLTAMAYTVERPSFFLDHLTFRESLGAWSALLPHRVEIERIGRSVGRVEIQIDREQSPVGTGFVVAKDVVLTNRHIAVKIALRKGKDWEVAHALLPKIDFAERRDGLSAREHVVESVLWVAPPEEPDAALLRISQVDGEGRPSPPPLPIAQSYRPRKARRVYLVGYPARLRSSPEPDVMDLVFAGKYDVKRLQPGRILGSSASRLDHDASTLGGNSGSCVVDLAEGAVVGLHYDGRPGLANYAVPLWKKGVRKTIETACQQAGG